MHTACWHPALIKRFERMKPPSPLTALWRRLPLCGTSAEMHVQLRSIPPLRSSNSSSPVIISDASCTQLSRTCLPACHGSPYTTPRLIDLQTSPRREKPTWRRISGSEISTLGCLFLTNDCKPDSYAFAKAAATPQYDAHCSRQLCSIPSTRLSRIPGVQMSTLTRYR
jgi:hypothetical protein